MVSEEVKRLSMVLTDEVLQAAGFSEEELNLEYLTETVIELGGIAYAMRLIYPIEGPKAIERHFQDGYERAQEALAVIEFSKKPAEYLTLSVVRGFIVENLLGIGIGPGVPKEREHEFLAEYRTERRWEDLPLLIQRTLPFIYLGRLCGLELGKRLAQNMHALEAIQLRDGIEDVKIKGVLHSLKTLPSGLLIPQKVEVTTGEELKNQCLESLIGTLNRSASSVKLLWEDDDARQGAINRLLMEEIKPKLMNQWSFRRTINEALSGELACLPKRAKDRIKNVRKKQQRESQLLRPKGAELVIPGFVLCTLVSSHRESDGRL